MWDGVFLPNMTKHRDFLHASVAEHLMANGIWTRGDTVEISSNPITGREYKYPRRAQKVDLTYHDKTYTYLIQYKGEQATETEIMDQINAHMANRIPGGRNWEDYLSDESRLEELLNGSNFSLQS